MLLRLLLYATVAKFELALEPLRRKALLQCLLAARVVRNVQGRIELFLVTAS